MKRAMISTLAVIVLVLTTGAFAMTTWQSVSLPPMPSGSYMDKVWVDRSGTVFFATQFYTTNTMEREARIYRLDQTGWTLMLTVPAAVATRIHGTSPTDLYVSMQVYTSPTTQLGRLYHYDGVSWSSYSLGAGSTCSAVDGAAGNIFASTYTGSGFELLKYVNGTWQSAGSIPDHGSGPMAYIGPNETWTTECWGHILSNGTTSTFYQGFDFCDVNDMWGMRDSQNNLSLYVVGANNWGNGVRVWRFHEDSPGSKTGSWGSKYSCDFSDGSGYLVGYASGVWGSGPNDVYVSGGLNPQVDVATFQDMFTVGYGRLYHWNGSTWSRIMDAGEFSRAMDVYGSSSDNVWVAAGGMILHYGPGFNCQNAKQTADGRWANLSGATVSAAYPDFFYIESDDRSSGIRVSKPSHGIQTGMRVDVAGKLKTYDDGERYIEAAEVVQNGNGSVKPVALAQWTLGGGDWELDLSAHTGQAGVANGIGLNNIGLLVTICGKVTASGIGWFYVDDGSNIMDGSGCVGVYVECPGVTPPAAGSMVAVTGISSCDRYLGQIANTLLPRGQDDVVIVDSGSDLRLLNSALMEHNPRKR